MPHSCWFRVLPNCGLASRTLLRWPRWPLVSTTARWWSRSAAWEGAYRHYGRAWEWTARSLKGRPSGSTGDGLSVLGGRGGQARTDPTRLSVWLPLPSAGDAIRFGQVRASSRPCDRLFSHSFIPHFVSLGLPGVIVSSRFATEEVNSLNAKPIVLKALLQQRHLQTHRAFCREYDRVAAVIDPTLRGSWPSKAQFYRWLSGDLVGLPYTDHCRILEGMFSD